MLRRHRGLMFRQIIHNKTKRIYMQLLYKALRRCLQPTRLRRHRRIRPFQTRMHPQVLVWALMSPWLRLHMRWA